MYAGFWKRFVAYCIDGIIIWLVTIPIKMASDAGEEFLILFAVWVLYFSLMESSPTQATLGKKLLGIKVTDAQGQRLTFVKALLRNLSKIISMFTLYIGFIMAAFTQKKQALHDIITDCLVVNNNFSPAEEAATPPQKSSTGLIIALVIAGLFFVVLFGGCAAAVVLPQYVIAVEKSRAAEALANLKIISDAANRYYLRTGGYSGIDINAAGNLDVSPPANRNFGFSLGKCSGSDCIINACRKASLFTSDAEACAAPKYIISFTLSGGERKRAFCTPEGEDTPCSALNPMLN
ncbi:MAG: RDD family protein [Elusimicrobium sp.]|jgi:uncharacterized RDD family membrane protein YckC/Tfp pilus assembly protein PilE|nr:RDD family protein [Elusimicrobium sp.]